MNEKPEALRLADRLDDERMNLIERLADENERLMTRLVEAKDKALRYDLDAAGISNREKEALELVELRAENERLREALTYDWDQLEACRESLREHMVEIKRLREALKLALNSHGRMLMSDPPQDAWKFNRVDEVIVAALRREET